MPRQSCVRVYIHFVWATWDRLPVITPAICDDVYRVMLAKCRELGGHLLALGGVEDHVHLLVRMPATVTIAQFIGEVKGSSSHAVTHGDPAVFFKWQGAYGAFAVGESAIPTVQHYIQTQETHHHTLGSCPEWRTMQSDDDEASG